MVRNQERSPEPSWPVGSHQAGQKQPEPLGAGAGAAMRTGRDSASRGQEDQGARMSWCWEAEMVEGKENLLLGDLT